MTFLLITAADFLVLDDGGGGGNEEEIRSVERLVTMELDERAV